MVKQNQFPPQTHTTNHNLSFILLASVNILSWSGSRRSLGTLGARCEQINPWAASPSQGIIHTNIHTHSFTSTQSYITNKPTHIFVNQQTQRKPIWTLEEHAKLCRDKTKLRTLQLRDGKRHPAPPHYTSPCCLKMYKTMLTSRKSQKVFISNISKEVYQLIYSRVSQIPENVIMNENYG